MLNKYSVRLAMTQHLPPNLLILFQARPPIPYLPPPEKNELPPYAGIANFVSAFEDPAVVGMPTPPRKIETKDEIKARLRKEKEEKELKKIEELLEAYKPKENEKATEDAYATLFVARINYETSERKLKREFEVYGPIKKVRLIKDLDGKPRGYAFIEFEKGRHMKMAYKQADGKKIDGKRVLVDFERGRTVFGWRPRRLAGGLGGTRIGNEAMNQKFSGREPPSSAGYDDRRDGRRSRDRRSSGDRDRIRDRRDYRRSREGDRRRRSGDRDRSRGRDRRERY